MKLKQGDNVVILYGKDEGRKGKVLIALAKDNKVIVEGMNVYSRHLKGDGKTRESEIVKIVKPLSTSKVMLVCPSCSKPTRVGYKIDGKKKNRFCKRCGKNLDSAVASEVIDKKAKAIKTEIIDVKKGSKDFSPSEKDSLRKQVTAGQSQQSYRNAGNK